ncbi:hypothetical protein V7128_19010 [Neobacillus vireti]|uniref:hypothetical protein n=1 Tax=Neobacillus vireti TaxID=220686 RepID=UPI002FFE5998
MIVYYGSTKKFDQFTIGMVVPHLPNGIDTIGFWFTSDIHAAKPFAIGTETVIEKSKTEFWDDGEPKVVQFEKPVSGFIYKVFIDDPNLMEFASYEMFMEVRDQYCDYFGTGKRNLTWKDQATLLNKEEANSLFRKNLIKKGSDGLVIRNMILKSDVTDLYCIFSKDALYIADVSPVDDIGII